MTMTEDERRHAAWRAWQSEDNYIRYRYAIGDITAKQMIEEQNRAIKRILDALGIVIPSRYYGE